MVAAIGAPGLHFHDLRHTGNTFAAAAGAGLRDLMARMGCAARTTRGTRMRPGSWSPRANGTLMARKIDYDGQMISLRARTPALTWGFGLERTKGIEPS